MKLIVFEGLDGSGKTTLIKDLSAYLTTQGYQTYSIRGLGSTALGEVVRSLYLNNGQLTPDTRYLLGLAALRQIEAEILQPLRHQPTLVLSDRWLASNEAYQRYPYQLTGLIPPALTRPWLTIYLDIDPALGLVRKQTQLNHQTDVIEQQPLPYFTQVRAGYWAYFFQQRGHVLILDGALPLTTNFTKIKRYLGGLLRGVNV
ncbi:MAG: dTMP kinase [Vigna little leaf phytoplasma]|nr:dTMP kinase [Vigna little leaf phytoplasma]